MNRRHPRIAFTLIELLVVIAVMTTLIAVLLPVLHSARSHAKRTQCQTQLRQIYTALQLYIGDYDGQVPRGANHNYAFGGWQGLGSLDVDRPLNIYLGIPNKTDDPASATVFKCPSDQGGIDYAGKAYEYYGNSYNANHLLIGPRTPVPAWLREPWRSLYPKINETSFSVKLETVKTPTQLVFSGDFNWTSQWDPFYTWACARTWHQRLHAFNLVFMDGHVSHLVISKGLFSTPEYRLFPDTSINKFVQERQVKVPCICGKP